MMREDTRAYETRPEVNSVDGTIKFPLSSLAFAISNVDNTDTTADLFTSCQQ